MKSLKDILNGTKKSKVVDGSTGTDPNVDYSAADAGTRDAVKKHKVEKHEDRVGNDDVPYEPKTKKAKFARHGGETKAYEETTPKAKDSESTKTASDTADTTPKAGKRNPKFDPRRDDENDKFHEETEINELSQNTLKSYKAKATKDGEKSKERSEYYNRRAQANRDKPDKVYDYYQHKDDAREYGRKAKNREAGVAKASEKLKEGTKFLNSILEISRGTVTNYIDKAVDSDKDRRPGLKLALKKKHGDAKVPAKKSIDEAKKIEGYQKWPGDKKKKFFQTKETSADTKKWVAERQKAREEAAKKEDN